MSLGSATGNPRNKTALKPGHSLMNWIHLGNSGTDLTGVGGKRLLVSKSELAKHNTETDCWLCIRGIVYNVTRYMDFHPGGKEELMKGAGIDATELFNKVHAWVNYESILQKCIVGKLGALGDEDTFKIPVGLSLQQLSKLRKTTKVSSTSSIQIASPLNQNISKTKISMDWFQQLNFICLVFYLKTTCPRVSITLTEKQTLKLYFKETSLVLELENPVRWPCIIKFNLNIGKLQIQLKKEEAKIWKCHSSSEFSSNDQSDNIKTHNMKVVKSSNLTQNIVLLTLQYSHPVYNYVPVGHHVYISHVIDNMKISKPYTPIEQLQRTSLIYDDTLLFLIKSYSDGILSPQLCSLCLDQEIEVSIPEGKFDVSTIGKKENLVLVAAGTGITPMISIVNWAIQTQRYNVKLLFFNKTEEDIVWRDEFDDFAKENKSFTVEHILSEPSSSWEGISGRISQNLLQKYVPVRSNDLPSDTFVCVCGPILFNNVTEQYLTEMNFSKEEYFCFSG